MATSDQFIASKRAAGAGQARTACSRLMTFTVAGTGTLSDSTITLPAGSWFRGVTLDTPTAISGVPTTCNFRFGTAAAGQQIVSDVDAKGQGHISTTIVAGFDKVGTFVAADTPLFGQLVTTGGTAPAGTIYALVSYDSPVF